MRTYGYSDDIVTLEDDNGNCIDEIDAYRQDIHISFSDNTVICIHYGKPNKAIWAITIEKKGNAKQVLTICNDETAEIYSDVFEIEADISDIKKKYH